MKFKMTVKNLKTGDTWAESYDVVSVIDKESCEKWAVKCIAGFNETLRPGESPREFISIELEGESIEHSWDKDIRKMSTSGGYDGFFCRKCGVTGKRFGLSSTVRIDSKFKKKVFQTCTNEARFAVSSLINK